MGLSGLPEGHVGVERRRKGGAGQGWCRGLPARTPGGGIESSARRGFKEALVSARSRSSRALAERGPLLVRFPRPPGGVIDLGSSLLSPAPWVLEREGPTSGHPHPRPASRLSMHPGLQRVASGRPVMVWMAGKRSSPPVASQREGLLYSEGEGGRGPRCSAAADRGRHWPPKRHWLGISPTCPRAPRGAGSEEGGVPDRHPQPPAPAPALRPAPLKPAH